MIYIDSSTLLKILWDEPESQAVREAVAREAQVIVSSLTDLETEVQLRAKCLSGGISQGRYKNYRAALASFRKMAPFEFHQLPGSVFPRAIQHLESDGKLHCRSLDRLHLAAMTELGIRRLLTNDAKQATAARALGCEVITPG